MIGSIIFALGFCITFLGVLMYRRWGISNRLFDVPNDRSMHSEPTPHGAGLIIVIVCLITYIPISVFVSRDIVWGYFIGASMIALISFLDDIFSIRFSIRLFVHALAAIVLIYDTGTWHGVTMLGGLQLGVWGYVITFLWVVWMVNSYNFMDGIDGLAALQAVIAASGWMVLGFLLSMPALYLFSAIIASASLGFLVHNLSSSRIFMGDVGSAFLGFTFAALPLLARNMATYAWDLLPIAAVLFVWFFLFDSVITLVGRGLRGKKIWIAHREHLFQRLVSSGMSHRQVTAIYGFLATLLSLSVLISVRYREDIGLAMFPVVFALTAILLAVVYTRRVKNGVRNGI